MNGILVVGMVSMGVHLTYVVPIYAALLLINFPFAAATALEKERQEGTLEFLCGLPLTGRVLALARTLALLEGVLVLGFFSATAVLLFFSDSVAPLPLVALAAGAFLGSSVALVASATCFTLLSLRFRPEHITAAILLAVVVPAAIFARLDVPFPQVWPSLGGIGLTPASAVVGVVFVSGIIGLVAFDLLARAFERCVQDPSLARARSD